MHTKFKKKYVKLLVDEINKNKTITLHELNQKLKDKYKDANLSTTQMLVIVLVVDASVSIHLNLIELISSRDYNSVVRYLVCYVGIKYFFH